MSLNADQRLQLTWSTPYRNTSKVVSFEAGGNIRPISSAVSDDPEWFSRPFQPRVLIQLFRTPHTGNCWNIGSISLALSMQYVVEYAQDMISMLLSIRFVERNTSLQWTSSCDPRCSHQQLSVLSSTDTYQHLNWNSETRNTQVCSAVWRVNSYDYKPWLIDYDRPT